MLLCDPMGDLKVSWPGSVVWDCGWWCITPFSLGATFILHLLEFSAFSLYSS